MGTKQRLRAERREAEQAEQRANLSVKFSVDDADDLANGVTQTDGGVEIDLGGQSDAAPLAPAVEITTEPDHEDEGDDPLEVLRRQFDEVKAEREASDRRALELEKANREQQAALAQKTVAELGNQKALLEQAYNVEEHKLSDTKRKYAEALRQQDFDAAAEAQIEITKTTALMGRYADAYAGLEAQEKAPKQAPQAPQAPQQAGDPFEAALTKMDPRVAEWAREHKDDVISRKDLAFSADALAVRKGLKPGSDAYLDFMDEQMGYLEADPAPAPVQKQVPRVSKRMPAAPGSRSSTSSGATNKVFLTEFDRDQARQLKMSDKEYAAFKLKSNEGQLTPAQAGGRLHARYTA